MNVQDYGIKVRSEAIGMLKAGLAPIFKSSFRTVPCNQNLLILHQIYTALGNLKRCNIFIESVHIFVLSWEHDLTK